MKRDMDLVRKLLFKLEQQEDEAGLIVMHVEGVDEQTLSGHIHLMCEAGLIDARDLSTKDGPAWMPQRLTWRGHEFVEAIRSDSVWEKLKRMVREKTGGLALTALEAGAKHLIANMFGGSGAGDQGSV